MPLWIWFAFTAFVLAMLLVDLGLFHRRPHAITTREALGWTVIWATVALAFSVGVYFLYEYHPLGIGAPAAQGDNGTHLTGSQAALTFLAGFVLEKSLSLDNIFVIALIFAYFNVPSKMQHRVLFWGIIGVLILRGTLIVSGWALLNLLTWTNYIFGALLIGSAFKMLRVGDEQVEPDKNPLVKLVRHIYPVSGSFEGGRFFTTIAGQPAITPLFVVLLVVESTDLMFAFDSIPAVLAITKDPFLVFTSNVFAVLGLRSLYFVLAGILNQFRYLKTSLFLVLVYVGLKMLLVNVVHVDVVASLIVIVGILSVGGLASVTDSTGESGQAQEGQAPAAEGADGRGRRRSSLAPADTTPAIQASGVTKFYGTRRGIVDLSLTIPRGSMVGLLGPPGAGKTTAIRIFSCHIPPTSGAVRVCGHDVCSQSEMVRKHLGYLPENCPLYPEMPVREYLRWTAQMKRVVRSSVKGEVAQIIQACSLESVRSLAIGTLSPAHRQRVGLAAALVGGPDVLILDEPTAGLDPVQARELCGLIGSLKQRHTVLISSHLTSEIDAICDSIILLHQGSVVARGSPDQLRDRMPAIYTVECPVDPSLKRLVPPMIDTLPGVTLVKCEEDSQSVRFRLSCAHDDTRLEIFRLFSRADISIREMFRERVELKDVFTHYVEHSSQLVREAPAVMVAP